MNPVTGLSLGRIAIGAGALAAPELASKLFKLDTANNPQLPYMLRMFGSREIALGAVTLVSKGAARRQLVALGIAVDGADAYAGYDAMQTGAVDQKVGIGLVAPAVFAVGAGFVGLFARTRAGKTVVAVQPALSKRQARKALKKAAKAQRSD
ncbi:hypothetical protein ABIE44_003827 [Marmoricola sp. OAE513]|uniref:hypothetical protein n=1 Tax=Marmoricola sp. OAE513 TaxID=2817894 RepID=UPI001AE893B0